MTTTASPTRTDTVRAPAGRRLLSLVRAEMLLLFRNKTALFNAVALAPLTVAFVAWASGDLLTGGDAAAGALAGTLLAMLTALALAVVVYYNLTTTFVARREELVLKRLLTGDVSKGEIVLAYATPAVLITGAQIVLGLVAMAVLLDPPEVQNPVWLLVALAGGAVVFALLAAASSGLTRTVETAQLTTLPILMVATALSGIVVPLHSFPDVFQTVASWTPMYPVVALVQHGLGAVRLDGTAASGALADVAQPLACLALWAVLGLLAARRWMRWEPRR
ncbi:ABC transporter permease [Georgenia subflava]|uniref:ABC transporter permease n=1 Tax=Georgenia subflava TaxID=1622177 RepID=A0A6N7EJI5_9MICO|nr:ABC transporter permease [Georgenia subflava]MPV38250.1 ABC transporter permease [Georgenia subflava]